MNVISSDTFLLRKPSIGNSLPQITVLERLGCFLKVNYFIVQLFISILLVFITANHGLSQSIDMTLGAWRHHLPSNSVISLSEAPHAIYAATPFGIIEYNRTDNSVRKIDKVSGLTGFGISVIKYSPEEDLLLIGYQDGQIDILQNGRVTSVPDIRQSAIFGSKRVNNILFSDRRAYLSCDFGIVMFDLEKFVILDTWFIGPEGSITRVHDLLKTDNYFYAATDAGILKAPVGGRNLADFRFWNQVRELPVVAGRYNHIAKFDDKIFVNFSGQQTDTLYYFHNDRWNVFNPFGNSGFFAPKVNIYVNDNRLIVSANNRIDIFSESLAHLSSIVVYANDWAAPRAAMLDNEGALWIADSRQGLIRELADRTFESIVLNGPASSESFRIAHAAGKLWLAPGAIIGGWQPTWNDRGIFLFEEGSWSQFWRWQYPQTDIIHGVRDILHITPHIRNPNRAFASAWAGGLIEVDKDEGIVTVFDETNSTLQRRAGVGDVIRIGGSAWDSRGNLWVSNSDADHFLSVLRHDGTWMSFPHNGLIVSGETLGPLIVDDYDQKWVSLPRGGGLIVFREHNINNNNSFDIRKLTTQTGNGALPNTSVLSLAKDHNGHIWVGTAEGVVVFYSPQMALRGGPFDAQPIVVMQDGFTAWLFENEAINSIFVDGSNKKWFGTRSSGAFLMSPDARETILHFNTANSPLPSNNILDISVEPHTGEVFFATDMGLVSFRGFATRGQPSHTNVEVFPNPVRPGYQGYIAVRGLVTNARVKITDISGNLIYDTYAQGGQMVWSGTDLFGKRPASGVYLVFTTNADGSETMVAKILFMN